jgi:hypothetical protein
LVLHGFCAELFIHGKTFEIVLRWHFGKRKLTWPAS